MVTISKYVLLKTDVDESFEWFMIIIGIVTGIMSGFQEFQIY